MNLKSLIKASRLPFITATVVPVVLGSVVAWHQVRVFNWVYFWLVLAGVSFLHFGTNMANDYFDHKSRNDWINKTPTPFSGGSRVIQEGLMKPGLELAVAIACFAIGSLIGLYINFSLKTSVVLILGIIGVFFGFFYTAWPFRLGYTGIGELLVALCFGPLVVIGAYYVQAASLSLKPLWASVPVGILVGLILFINEFPDYDADKAVGKNNLVVLFGKEKSAAVFRFLIWFTYLYIILGSLFNLLPRVGLIGLLSLPFALKAASVSRMNFAKVYEMLPANALTIKLHLAIGLLLSGGFILDSMLS